MRGLETFLKKSTGSF